MRLTIANVNMVIIAGVLLVPAQLFGDGGAVKLSTGPTAESALAADQELARALQNNDSAGIYHLLDKEWAVVTGFGDVVEGPSTFPDAISKGYRTLRAMELSEPRVRLFGNTALVTTKVRLSGQLGGKSYDNIKMRQTDVWQWKGGAWRCVLTHESMVKESDGTQAQSMGHYWFVMFSKGANWGQDSAATAKLFQDHIRYIMSQRATGGIVTGGAFPDKITWIGFEIYGGKTSEEVEKITEADPAVSSQLFSYEIHPWVTLKGEVKFE